MSAEIGADAIADDGAVSAHVQPVDRDLAARIGLLELLKPVLHDALGALLRPVLAGRVDAHQNPDGALLRK